MGETNDRGSVVISGDAVVSHLHWMHTWGGRSVGGDVPYLRIMRKGEGLQGGGGGGRESWWRQEESENQFKSTLEEISREARIGSSGRDKK